MPHSNDDSYPTTASFPTIILIGMRGAGKSSLGRHAANTHALHFLDIDESIINTHGPILNLITTHSWAHFRALELLTLQRTLSQHPTGCIIASGGGIVETAAAREFLKEHVRAGGVVVHVRRDMEALFEYLRRDGSRKALREDPRDIWERRRDWYEECAGVYFLAGAKAGKMGRVKGIEVEEDMAREEFCWFLEGLKC